MRKVFLSLFLVAFLTSYQAASATECLSLMDSQVCEGESSDSVFAKLPQSYVVNQDVTQTSTGLRVDKNYNYNGKKFSLRFERTSSDGPFRLTKITE